MNFTQESHNGGGEDNSNEDEKSHNSQRMMMSQKEKAKEKRRKRMPPAERSDLKQTLEHLVAAGSYNQRRHWRIQEHKRRKSEQQNSSESTQRRGQDESTTGTSGNADNGANETNHSAKVHIEDTFAFGENQRRKNFTKLDRRPAKTPGCWPATPKQLKPKPEQTDAGWFAEYGDDVDPSLFSEQYLSEMPHIDAEICEEDQEGRMVQPTRAPRPPHNLTYGRISQSNLMDQVVSRCWQRAVQAAASSMKVESEETEILEAPLPFYKLTVDTCDHLRISAPEDDPAWECPVCGATRLLHKERLMHFYGSKEIRGCAWHLIREKQKTLIEKVLHAEARRFRDVIVRDVVLSSTAPVETKKYDWQYVISKLKTRPAVDEADPTRSATFIDPVALDNTEDRLIERYTTVPK